MIHFLNHLTLLFKLVTFVLNNLFLIILINTYIYEKIGTAIIYPKGAAYMLSNTGDYKVISLKSKEVATMTVEILPCNGKLHLFAILFFCHLWSFNFWIIFKILAAGKVVDPKDGIKIEKPEQELLNKNVSFMFNIKSMKDLDAKYEVRIILEIFLK